MFRFALVALFAIFAFAETNVPKGAVETEPGVYKYTDSAGKVSIYRKTPFGVVKAEDKGEKPANASPFGKVSVPAKTEFIKARDRGEFVEFERPSPFGSYRWKRQKGELTPEEREALERTTGSKE